MNTRQMVFMSLTLAVGQLTLPVYAMEEFKLTASDAAQSDNLGHSVSTSGWGYAIVGAHGNDDAGEDSGAAYIFHWNGNSWAQQAKLIASDAEACDYFGYSVSTNENYAIVGAHGNDDAGEDSGAAYIFHWNGSSWLQRAKLTANDATTGDEFGHSVSIRGDYAVVGAHGNDDAGEDSGAAYIFHRNGNSWAQQAKINASDAEAGDQFGYSVSIYGDYAIVGAHLDDDAGEDSGAAYVFHRNGSSWTQQPKINASDEEICDQFGHSVSIRGDYAVVGAPFDENEDGSAYIFHWNGISWTEQAKLTAIGTAAFHFGSSVSISRDYAAVGNYGSAHIFRRNGNGWTEEAKFESSGASSYFGLSVSISGSCVVVGDIGDDDAGYHSGAAYIYKDWYTIPAPLVSECDYGNENDLCFKWTRPPAPSSIAGYSYRLTHWPNTIPPETVKCTKRSKRFRDVAAGTWYFHVRAVDGTGKWGDTAHYGPINIETVLPGVPVVSECNWGNENDLCFMWTMPSDIIDIAGYSVVFDNSPDTIPPRVMSYAKKAKRYYAYVANGTWYFHVRAVDNAGNWGDTAHYGPIEMEAAPDSCIACQNYPNPFNPETWIPFQLSERGEVTVRIYSSSGELVRELALGQKPAGFYLSKDKAAYWDGKSEAGEQVASGVYFYTIHAGDFTATRKMMVTK